MSCFCDCFRCCFFLVDKIQDQTCNRNHDSDIKSFSEVTVVRSSDSRCYFRCNKSGCRVTDEHDTVVDALEFRSEVIHDRSVLDIAFEYSFA